MGANRVRFLEVYQQPSWMIAARTPTRCFLWLTPEVACLSLGISSHLSGEAAERGILARRSRPRRCLPFRGRQKQV